MPLHLRIVLLILFFVLAIGVPAACFVASRTAARLKREREEDQRRAENRKKALDEINKDLNLNGF